MRSVEATAVESVLSCRVVDLLWSLEAAARFDAVSSADASAV